VYREVKPWLWEEQNGKRRLQAIVENGKVKRWGLEPYVFAFVFEPVPFMASPIVLMLLLAAVAVALFTALLWPIAAILRRKHGAPAPGRSTTLVRIASWMTVLSLVLWTISVVSMEELKDITVLLVLSQLTAFIGFLGGLLAALWHARTVFASGTRWARVLAVLWVLAFAVLVLVGFCHKVLSFNPNY
jgi:hypothetical protein